MTSTFVNGPHSCPQSDVTSGAKALSTAPREALAALLRHGPIEGQTAMDTLTTAGFTPKQIRGARERLGVAVTRHGFGKAAGSTWSLPSSPEPGNRHTAEGEAVARPDDLPQQSPLARAETHAPRHTRRVEFFVRAGMSAGEAAGLATLCDQRDGNGSRRVSCAECQNSTRLEWCAVVRSFQELHRCDFARLVGP
jgi:hypothetical protein